MKMFIVLLGFEPTASLLCALPLPNHALKQLFDEFQRPGHHPSHRHLHPDRPVPGAADGLQVVRHQPASHGLPAVG